MRPVARLGDQGVPHCSPYTIATGSPTVYAELRPVASVGDFSTPHLVPSRRCFPHAAPIITGSPTVYVNLRPVARVGDSLAGCTFVATGSFSVFAG